MDPHSPTGPGDADRSSSRINTTRRRDLEESDRRTLWEGGKAGDDLINADERE